jgi:hypothetical protein
MPQSQSPSTLNDALVICNSTVEQCWARADAAAVHYQRRHRVIVDVIAVTGTLAVVLGTVTLSQPIGSLAVRVSEAVAAAAAIVAVVLGLWAGYQRNWILERHKAERLRLIEYRALRRFVGEAGAEIDAWALTLDQEIATIERTSQDSLDQWVAGEDLVFDEFNGSQMTPRSDVLVHDVVAHYCANRIARQQVYFNDKARRNLAWDRRTRLVITALFFLSVAAIIPGAILRLFAHTPVSTAFITIAIVAPAIAAGVRLYRSAHEFARNSIRFRAKHVALHILSERLEHETSTHVLLQDLEYAERLFEAEHREWLRLMLDAEWYG